MLSARLTKYLGHFLIVPVLMNRSELQNHYMYTGQDMTFNSYLVSKCMKGDFQCMSNKTLNSYSFYQAPLPPPPLQAYRVNLVKVTNYQFKHKVHIYITNMVGYIT